MSRLHHGSSAPAISDLGKVYLFGSLSHILNYGLKTKGEGGRNFAKQVFPNSESPPSNF
jgi:hypothetical protein